MTEAVEDLILAAYAKFFEEAPLPLRHTPEGGGVFGSWELDAAGQPRYAYEMDHHRDARAGYRTSEGTSRDHWHVLGNDRITALAHNEGYVEVMDWDRAGKYINKWDPARRQFAGGYTYVQSAGRSWNTRWSQLPADATQQRFFGIGYVEKHTRCDGLLLVEHIEAPPGDVPALLSTSSVTNESNAPREVSLVEFWTANLHVLLPALVMTHKLGRVFTAWRRRFNRHFIVDARADNDAGVVWAQWRLKTPGRAPARDQATWGDYYPNAAFLAWLDSEPPVTYTTDGDAFLNHDAVHGTLVQHACARHDHVVLAAKRVLMLQPGETRTLRYLYGYAAPDALPDCVTTYAQRALTPPPRPQMEFITPDHPWLDRETRWHSYCLQANTIYQEFAKCHVVDQGSAYSALHGALGAHRDFALFALPLVYLRPDLARELLRFSMTSQDKDTGALPYAHIGFGKQSGAGFHASSSDLDLFFLWAVAEYLGATRDVSLLEEAIPYHPASAGSRATGLDHLRAAFTHLQQRVGVGRHGLLRCGTGDWNDALVAFSKRKLATIRRGESLLNAGLAALALPKLADALDAHAPTFAAQLRCFAAEQTQAARHLWTGRWWARGYLGVGDRTLGHDRLFLDCQAFPILAGLLAPSEQTELLASIQERCIAPQPWGAMALSPPMRGLFLQPGADTNGGIWAAVNAWAAWAMSVLDARTGWDFFLRTTMKQRAEAYPDIWYGIWSGPDACNAHCHARPGETYNHVVTPMTDFPVMNANYHAGPLLDLIKLAGIEPHGDALRIAPRLPFDRFVFRSPLVGIAYLNEACRGYYTPVVNGHFTFEVQPPAKLVPANATVFVEGEPTPCEFCDGTIRFSADGQKGQRIRWELRPVPTAAAAPTGTEAPA